MWHMYSNPEATGWLGWIDDRYGEAIAFVRLNRKVLFVHELRQCTSAKGDSYV